MFKNCTVINKLTGEMFQGQVDTELENVAEYPYREATQAEIDEKEASQQANLAITQKIQDIKSLVAQAPDVYQAAFSSQIQFGVGLLTQNPSTESVTRVIDLINNYPIVGFTETQMLEIEAIKQQLISILSIEL